MKIYTKVILIMALLLGATTLPAQNVKNMTEPEKQEMYQQKVREKLALDYSMPDYSIKKIDAKVMGSRLAKILESLCANYHQPHYLGMLNVIQSSQVDGLNYGRVKNIKLENVTKKDNEITICFNTTLESNSLNLKNSQLLFRFVDGVSEDTVTNDFYCSLCRYIKE